MSERHAATDDMDAQTAWRAVDAEVRAAQGQLADAEALSREAVRLAAKTDMLNRSGRAALALANALRRQGRFDEASASLEDAARFFERKGNVVWARRARERLDGLVRS